jgi:hypothetical protein
LGLGSPVEAVMVEEVTVMVVLGTDRHGGSELFAGFG